jgi:hypothetical protein
MGHDLSAGVRSPGASTCGRLTQSVVGPLGPSDGPLVQHHGSISYGDE